MTLFLAIAMLSYSRLDDDQYDFGIMMHYFHL